MIQVRDPRPVICGLKGGSWPRRSRVSDVSETEIGRMILTINRREGLTYNNNDNARRRQCLSYFL